MVLQFEAPVVNEWNEPCRFSSKRGATRGPTILASVISVTQSYVVCCRLTLLDHAWCNLSEGAKRQALQWRSWELQRRHGWSLVGRFCCRWRAFSQGSLQAETGWISAVSHGRRRSLTWAMLRWRSYECFCSQLVVAHQRGERYWSLKERLLHLQQWQERAASSRMQDWYLEQADQAWDLTCRSHHLSVLRIWQRVAWSDVGGSRRAISHRLSSFMSVWRSASAMPHPTATPVKYRHWQCRGLRHSLLQHRLVLRFREWHRISLPQAGHRKALRHFSRRY